MEWSSAETEGSDCEKAVWYRQISHITNNEVISTNQQNYKKQGDINQPNYKNEVVSINQPNCKTPHSIGYSNNCCSCLHPLRYLIFFDRFIQNAAKYLCNSVSSLSHKLASSSPLAAVKFSTVSDSILELF